MSKIGTSWNPISMSYRLVIIYTNDQKETAEYIKLWITSNDQTTLKVSQNQFHYYEDLIVLIQSFPI